MLELKGTVMTMALVKHDTSKHEVAPRRLEFFDRLFNDWPEVLRRPVVFWPEHGADSIGVEEFIEDGALVVRVELAGVDPDRDIPHRNSGRVLGSIRADGPYMGLDNSLGPRQQGAAGGDHLKAKSTPSAYSELVDRSGTTGRSVAPHDLRRLPVERTTGLRSDPARTRPCVVP